MTLVEFEEKVSGVLARLPKKFKDQLDNVQVVVSAWPSGEELARIHGRKHSLLYGLYWGVPKTKRSIYSTLPDKITIYAGPILYSSRTLDHAKKLIKSTVLHEIGHHFGMSEEEIRRAERAYRS